MATNDADEAARRRAERRRRILAEIRSLEMEFLQLEEEKGKYERIRTTLFQASSNIDSGYNSLNVAYNSLNTNYPSNRTNKLNRKYFDDAIAENSEVKSSVADFINYVGTKINELNAAIRDRESEISSLKNSL